MWAINEKLISPKCKLNRGGRREKIDLNLLHPFGEGISAIDPFSHVWEKMPK